MPSPIVWEIPQPLSVCEIRLDEDTMTRVRRHGNPDGPRLILSHGNGLAIDLYYPFWSLLADDFDLIVYDLRNHGWNAVSAQKHHNIPTLIHDHDIIFDAIACRFGCKPTVGVFHSLSTLITLLSIDSIDRRYSGLVLFDPPLCKPVANESEFDAAAERMAERTRRRGYHFRTREEFAEHLGYMPSFLRVLPGVRDLMAWTTLRQCSLAEGYELRCPREYEAQIADYVRCFAPLLDLAMLPCPTKVIGADPTLPYAYLPTFDLHHIFTVDYDFIPETTHLLQLERPEECVAILRQFLDSKKLF